MEVETVKVVAPVSDGNPHGYIVINKSDLTENHELFVERAPDAAPEATTKARARKD